MIWLLKGADVTMTIAAKDASAAALISAAFEDLALEPVNHVLPLSISVTSTGSSEWLIEEPNCGFKRKVNSEGDLVYHLSDRVIFNIADKATTGHCLHAAAVSKQGKACVIPAESGAGKSSLTSWLVANGFAYMTDELIVVDSAERITGVARPIQIKSHGLDVIEPLLTAQTKVYRGGFANAITAQSLGGDLATPSPKEIAIFLLPKYQKESGYSLRQLPSAEAGLRLMSNHVNARNLKHHGFRAMMKLIRETRSYELEYGGFEKLPADFAADLAKLMK